MKRKLIITYCIIALISSVASGQSPKVSLEFSPDFCQLDSLRLCDSLKNVVEEAFNEYLQYASLFDEAKGQVTQEYIDAFSNLFYYGNAHKIFDDVGKECINRVTVRNYTTRAYLNFQKNGHPFRLGKVILTELRQTSNNAYIATVELLKKEMLNGIDREGNPIKYPAGRKFGKNNKPSHTIEYDIPPDDFSAIKINRLNGQCGSLIRYNRYSSFNLNYNLLGGNGVTSPDIRGFSAPNHSVQNKATIGISGIFRTNFGNRSTLFKKLNIIGGLGINKHKYELIITDASCKGCKVDADFNYNDEEKGDYTRDYVIQGEGKGIKEKVRVNSLVFSIGLGYQLMEWKRGKVFLDGILMPTIFSKPRGELSGTINNENFSYSEIDELKIKPSDVPKYNINPYYLTEHPIIDKITQNNGFVNTGFRLALNVYLQKWRTLGITGGIYMDFYSKLERRSDYAPFLNIVELVKNHSAGSKRPEGVLISNFGITNRRYLGLKLGVIYHFEKEKYKF